MGNIISSIKNRIQISNQNKEREYVIKNKVTDIGEIVEEKDKIICYVKQDLLINQCRCSADNIFYINGFFDDDDEYNVQYLEKLKLNKPIYYIFDGIDFEWRFTFSSKGNCNVIFNNCIFKKGIFIKDANNVIFVHNTYYDYHLRFSDYLTGNNIKNLTFVNEIFVNKSTAGSPNRFGIDITADKIKIMNSNIDCGKSGDVNLRAHKLIIKSSNINALQMVMDADKVIYFDNDISSYKRVIINNKNKDYIGYITSPIIVYNDVMIKPINGFLKDVSEIELINHSRLELVLKLHQISMLCKKIEDRKVESTKRMLDEQTIGIISRKEDDLYKYREELLNKLRIELINKLSDIRDYYLLVSNKKVDKVRDDFSKQSISKVLKRDDLGF